MMLPARIYQLLPALYLILAVLLTVLFDSVYRFVPAAFFAASAVMVYIWRIQNRKKQQS